MPPSSRTRAGDLSPLSKLDTGSSTRNSEGRRTIARPIATRCFWPPERWAGLRPSWSPMIRAATSATRSRRGSGSRPAIMSGKPMFSSTDICGRGRAPERYVAGDRWLAAAPSSRRRPDDGTSRPAIIRSTVDFPHPDRPSRDQKFAVGHVKGHAVGRVATNSLPLRVPHAAVLPGVVRADCRDCTTGIPSGRRCDVTNFSPESRFGLVARTDAAGRLCRSCENSVDRVACFRRLWRVDRRLAKVVGGAGLPSCSRRAGEE